ncbi:hypothetical protein ONS95_005287 [Cadophora gregata]|uniref:uncharacterized protein n=1 Tax=Cadophora gregata TaxID=51156 RepID=UPI0026DBD601|nr:uncharacterized protein ONS95_005287 [Cadophora gregata]KAK0103253.1 hypothetical protein ONS95_005287 [Cadophora gregata]KAK0107444.1 hypothetical protein ONS96_003261 [Cadophora gregata f. sp. sojae]
MFSVSALHLAHLHTSSPDQHLLSQRFQQIATYHHTKSLAMFRKELQNLNEENAAACAACSSFLSIIPWIMPGAKGENIFFPTALPPSSPPNTSSNTSDFSPMPNSFSPNAENENRTIVPWYKLHRGGHQIVALTYNWIARGSNSELVDIISPWKPTQTSMDPVTRVMKIHLGPAPNAASSISKSIPHHASHPISHDQGGNQIRDGEIDSGFGFGVDFLEEEIEDDRQTPISDSERLTRLAECWALPIPNTPHPTLSQTDITALNETLATLRYAFSIVSPAPSPSSSCSYPPTNSPPPSSPSPSPSPIAKQVPKFSISPTIATLSWPTMLPAHFCSMLESRAPEALVLVAVYCVLLKRTGDTGGLFFITGKGESLVRRVGGEMGMLRRRMGSGGGGSRVDGGGGIVGGKEREWGVEREGEKETWERGGWEEWVRREMGVDFR